MNIRKIIAGSVLAAALAAVSGCGSSGEETSAGSPSPSTASSMGTSTGAEPQPSTSGPAGDSKNTTSNTTGGSKEQAGKIVITVKDFEFNGPTSVPPGATITIVNEDSVPHTVTSEEEGVFDVRFEGGETVTFTAPEEPGKYPYICTIHPAMMSTLVVE